MNLVVVGVQWGDEGKGKIVDLLSSRCGAVVRFHGGANAGHTLVVGDTTTVLHLIPSGILHKGVKCIIGNGVVFDPETCLEEIQSLKTMGFLKDASQLIISDRAHVVFSYHKEIDRLREEKRSGDNKIGTTGRGIGPVYEDKAARTGIRCGELVNEEILKKRLGAVIPEKSVYIEKVLGGKPIDGKSLVHKYIEIGKKLRPYVKNVQVVLADLMDKNTNVLFEGAQGSLLDIDHGTYPFVTSSTTLAANAAIGGGLCQRRIDKVLGVCKAYCTRVGNGPFMTELKEETGLFLRTRGGEFGSTTGRPRRTGWLDLVGLKYTAMLNGVDLLAITKLDVLTGLDEIRVCTSYELDGEKVDYLPAIHEDLERIRPIYEKVKGWTEEITGLKKIEQLPVEARRYIEMVEDFAGVPVCMISTGKKRDENITLTKLF